MSLAVIDPGHGGTADVGRSTAFGQRFGSGEHEKDVNLALGRRIAATLPGQVRLTRDGDINLSLPDRIGAARASGARAFVSVHSGAHGHNEVFVHERAGTDDLALAGVLSRALGAPISQAPLAVLDPRAHVPGCARCLVELDPRLGGADGVDHLAGAVARGLAEFLGAAGARYGEALTRGRYAGMIDEYLRQWVVDRREVETLHDLMRRSSTFVGAVRHLDAHVLRSHEGQTWDGDARGHMVSGEFAGRWLLSIAAFDGLGNRFIPAGDPDLSSGVNTVVVELPASRDASGRGTFIEHLVHETLHARNLVDGVPAPTGTMAGDAAAFIREEADVRRRTLAIMREIAIAGFRIPTPPMAPRDVERDLRSGDDALTYLESFVTSRMIRDAATAERLDAGGLAALQQQAMAAVWPISDTALMSTIGGLVLMRAPGADLFTEPASIALRLMVRRRAISERWRRFNAGGFGTTNRETILQQHATALFPSGIAYTP